eukprot:GHVS01019577.1.p1 GENE.GHVS01019577.1~~GHVS01019577.1.p1  ORF type:complete len:154 (-),score=12.12 GHVS01019577.1:106-567(-)
MYVCSYRYASVCCVCTYSVNWCSSGQLLVVSLFFSLLIILLSVIQFIKRQYILYICTFSFGYVADVYSLFTTTTTTTYVVVVECCCFSLYSLRISLFFRISCLCVSLPSGILCISCYSCLVLFFMAFNTEAFLSLPTDDNSLLLLLPSLVSYL